MEKNSEFIRTKEFHVVFKGYNPEEVDKFLDIVSVEFERLMKKNRELQESLDRVKYESTEAEDTDIKKIIQDALISAHKVADEIKSKAKTEAEEMMQNIRQEQEQSISDLEKKKTGLEEKVAGLQNKYYEFKNRISEELEKISNYLSNAEDKDILEPIETSEPEEVPEEKQSGQDYEYAKDEGPGDSDDKSSDENIIINETEETIQQEEWEEVKEEEKAAQENEKPASHSDQVDADERLNEEKNRLNEEGLKRERKKIDIANPDIIENFFRTNNE